MNVSSGSLRTLHRIHQQLIDLKDRLARGPKQTRAHQARVERADEGLAKLQQDIKNTRMTIDKKQVDLKSAEAKLEELHIKRNTAKSNREFQALNEHIAADEMAKSVLEDEILEAMDKLDTLQGQVSEAEKAVQQARAKAERVRAEVTSKEPIIRQDIQRLEKELKECEAGMPGEFRELYRRVVRAREGDALAAVEGEYCGGCNQHVPLNVINGIMLGQPAFCRACGRLLYLPEEDPTAPSHSARLSSPNSG
jgi:predicted  nucleic acid-binding Zn-ribbon protein